MIWDSPVLSYLNKRRFEKTILQQPRFLASIPAETGSPTAVQKKHSK